MVDINDNQLWDQLRAGNKSALKDIYDLHYPYLVNYGKKIFQDVTIVEDNIHDLFVELWNRHKSLGPTNHIGKYLAASLRRRIISSLKKNQKLQAVDSFDNIDFQAELSIEELIIGSEHSEEMVEKIKNAFEALSARQKEVLYLRFYQNLDYEEIADVVGIRYQSLRNLISTGIKKLRETMSVFLIFF